MGAYDRGSDNASKIIQELESLSAHPNTIEHLVLHFIFGMVDKPENWWGELSDLLCDTARWPELKEICMRMVYVRHHKDDLRGLKTNEWKSLPRTQLAGLSANTRIRFNYSLPDYVITLL